MVFSNTKDSEFTKGDDDSEITITREGNFTESSDVFVEEINIFAGGENKITFQQVYSKTFLCQYELQLYPFDTQVHTKLRSSCKASSPAKARACLGVCSFCNFEIMQRCTMDLELRELERASINLIPKIVMMESKTVLTQYIISKWSLEYKTESIKHRPYHTY